VSCTTILLTGTEVVRSGRFPRIERYNDGQPTPIPERRVSYEVAE
jgi:hypothetical protein